jgi:hypothetical protein
MPRCPFASREGARAKCADGENRCTEGGGENRWRKIDPATLRSRPPPPESPVSPSFLLFLSCVAGAPLAAAADPLYQRIDAVILSKAARKPASARAGDAKYLRRAYLDFAIRIPPVTATRAFLADKSPDKRARLIDQFFNRPDYPKRMADVFHIMWMERLGDHGRVQVPVVAFWENRPWDRMAREILRADPADAASCGADFFFAKHVENYGQKPVDYPSLTRDLGRRCTSSICRQRNRDDLRTAVRSGLLVSRLSLADEQTRNPRTQVVSSEPVTAIPRLLIA